METGPRLTRGVFISYAREDLAAVRVASTLLRAGGVDVFLDVDDLRFGDEWDRSLEETIELCDRVLVFWSVSAAKSRWVQWEISTALKHRRRIVPIQLDSEELPERISRFHGVRELHQLLRDASTLLAAQESCHATSVKAKIDEIEQQMVGPDVGHEGQAKVSSDSLTKLAVRFTVVLFGRAA